METDEEIYDRFLGERNEEDLRILFNRHKESLTLFLNGFVHNIDDAEELMLDAFAEAAAGPTLFSRRSSFKTWLFSIGKNLARMSLRKAGREASLREAVGDGASVEDYGAPDLFILRSERNRRLYEAMSHLKDEYREILILLYFEDMSREEAGRVMGRSRKQIYNLAERGKKALREQLEKMGLGYGELQEFTGKEY
ncbi:MAG: RNA polymerase sigma factor [Lachnospiraceae bacterium]|nr:RNA polymerase sigma factor [Lachnospiraceae bacterium]